MKSNGKEQSQSGPNRRMLNPQVILDTLDELKMRYLKPDKNHRKEFQSIRELLTK
jgi:hypothetical protein